MKGRSFLFGLGWRQLAVCAGAVAIVGLTPSGWAVEKQAFQVRAMYVEGCSCSAPCTCQLTGVEPSCQGVNAIVITSGRYHGEDLSGGKIAFATVPAKWVRLYVAARTPQQRPALAAFAEAYASGFGKIEQVKDAQIDVEGKEGHYTLKVDGGKTMSLVTEPVLGGDGKKPLVYSNIHDALHGTVKQGKTITGSFSDGGHSFQLKDSNSYFHDGFESTGSL